VEVKLWLPGCETFGHQSASAPVTRSNVLLWFDPPRTGPSKDASETGVSAIPVILIEQPITRPPGLKAALIANKDSVPWIQLVLATVAGFVALWSTADFEHDRGAAGLTAYAQHYFAGHSGVSAIAAGTNRDAATPISGDLVEWADIVFVMEKSHRNKVMARFREQLRDKRLVVLAVPDKYEFMDPQLVQLLRVRVARYIGAAA
jgi:predicted protein tyrosine phosphatase